MDPTRASGSSAIFGQSRGEESRSPVRALSGVRTEATVAERPADPSEPEKARRGGLCTPGAEGAVLPVARRVATESAAPQPHAYEAPVTRTFLITWHPKRWRWTDLPRAIDDVATAGVAHDRWSVGNRTDLPQGSRVFLMRLGEPPKGIVGSG